jgi:hypothetical protein
MLATRWTSTLRAKIFDGCIDDGDFSRIIAGDASVV